MLAADPGGAEIVAFRGQRFESRRAASGAVPHLQLIRKVRCWAQKQTSRFGVLNETDEDLAR
jgi:hypothetical protein